VAAVAAAAASGFLATGPGVAQQPLDEPAPAFFGEVSSRLANLPGVSEGRPMLRRAPAQLGSDTHGFIEFLQAHKQQLILDLKRMTDAATVVSAFVAVREALEAKCEPGTLQPRDSAPRIAQLVFGQSTDAMAARRFSSAKIGSQFPTPSSSDR
jgi:hypothetical protein